MATTIFMLLCGAGVGFLSWATVSLWRAGEGIGVREGIKFERHVFVLEQTDDFDEPDEPLATAQPELAYGSAKTGENPWAS